MTPIILRTVLDLALRWKVSPSTIRNWERAGALVAEFKTSGGQRLFTDKAADTFARQRGLS